MGLRQAWDLGPFAECLHLDKRLPKQQRNYKGLKITVQSAVGENYGLKEAKRPKTQLPLLQSWEQEKGCQEQKQGLHMPSAHKITKGVGRPPKPPLQPDPWTCPYPHPI